MKVPGRNLCERTRQADALPSTSKVGCTLAVAAVGEQRGIVQYPESTWGNKTGSLGATPPSVSARWITAHEHGTLLSTAGDGAGMNESASRKKEPGPGGH